MLLHAQVSVVVTSPRIVTDSQVPNKLPTYPGLFLGCCQCHTTTNNLKLMTQLRGAAHRPHLATALEPWIKRDLLDAIELSSLSSHSACNERITACASPVIHQPCPSRLFLPLRHLLPHETGSGSGSGSVIELARGT